ncbi:unnamed protein product [Amoebophrya sp. A25]|nr:unnamed protein product [Amoebophrya sp. A25]|eukprot:GSA25T00006393001.1
MVQAQRQLLRSLRRRWMMRLKGRAPGGAGVHLLSGTSVQSLPVLCLATRGRRHLSAGAATQLKTERTSSDHDGSTGLVVPSSVEKQQHGETSTTTLEDDHDMPYDHDMPSLQDGQNKERSIFSSGGSPFLGVQSTHEATDDAPDESPSCTLTALLMASHEERVTQAHAARLRRANCEKEESETQMRACKLKEFLCQRNVDETPRAFHPSQRGGEHQSEVQMHSKFGPPTS